MSLDDRDGDAERVGLMDDVQVEEGVGECERESAAEVGGGEADSGGEESRPSGDGEDAKWDEKERCCEVVNNPIHLYINWPVDQVAE